jgi:hypothetical protein
LFDLGVVHGFHISASDFYCPTLKTYSAMLRWKNCLVGVSELKENYEQKKRLENREGLGLGGVRWGGGLPFQELVAVV